MANYGNQIQTTRNALGAKDPLVAGLVSMLAGAPTARGTSRAFAKGLNQTTSDINKTDYTAGYTGSQSMVNSIASALGLGGAGTDISGTMDSPDNSLVQQSMRAGAANMYSGAEASATQNAYQNRMSLMNNLFNARESAFNRNQGNKLQLAQLLDAAGLTGGSASINISSNKFKQGQDKTPGNPVLDASGNPAKGKNGKPLVWVNGGNMQEKGN